MPMYLSEQCVAFLKQISASISHIKLDQNEGANQLLTIFTIISNENLFGKDHICKGVFVRYRQILKEFVKLLVEINTAQVDVVFIPLLSKKCDFGESYTLFHNELNEMVSEMDILPIEQTDLKKGLHFDRLSNSVRFALRRRRDEKIYILEETMYLTASLLGDLFSGSVVVDIGSGSGNMASVLLTFVKPYKIYLYEYSTELCAQLEVNLWETYKSNCIKIVAGDCLDAILPSKCDVLSISINPDAIITFIHKRKNEIINMLGENGVALFFIGEPKTEFTNSLLLREKYYLGDWPWYENVTPLQQIFRFLITAKFRNEIIALASNSQHVIKKLMSSLRSFGLNVENLSRSKDNV